MAPPFVGERTTGGKERHRSELGLADDAWSWRTLRRVDCVLLGVAARPAGVRDACAPLSRIRLDGLW